MKEYNWREEREKYKVPFRKEQEAAEQAGSSEPQPPQPPQPPEVIPVTDGGKGGGVWKAIGVLVVLALLALAVFAIWKTMAAKEANAEQSAHQTLVSNPGAGSSPKTSSSKVSVSSDSATALQNVVDVHKHAVGLVALWVTLQNGRHVILPIGTAWAFAPNKFATNAHVAVGTRQTRKQFLWRLARPILWREIKQLEKAVQSKDGKGKEAAKEKEEEYDDEVLDKKLAVLLKIMGEEAFGKLVHAAMNEALENNVKEMGVEIRVNAKNNVSLPVTDVQVHRKYGLEDGTSFNPDVAVLTIKGDNTDFFPLAKHETLKGLKQGTPVAYLGFPMQNLADDNVNLESPGATMQTGIVAALSDFNLKDAGYEGNYLLRHTLPSTGGASGSPMFNTAGEVIGLLYAINADKTSKSDDSEYSPNAAQVNYAVRVDLLEGLGEPMPIMEWLEED